MWNSVLPAGVEWLCSIAMSRTLVLIIYNCLLPVLFLVAFPAWLVKMWKRGGYGSGLLERFAYFKAPAVDEPKEVVYIHAVSVGEVLIALKLIQGWQKIFPEDSVVLAATTSTGHDVALSKSPENVRVIYSPIDFGFLVRSVFRRFSPSQIILIEAEAWPNLLNIARKNKIPVSMVNVRLSQRSEARYQKFSNLVLPLFRMVSCYCVQNDGDAERFAGLGIPREQIKVAGSIKFDPVGGDVPKRRREFKKMLDDFGVGRQVVIAASTHQGEEQLIGDAHLQSGSEALLVVVPRHAERRSEVVSDLEASGFEVVLRSRYAPPNSPKKACLVVDSTGELRDWTAHADLLIIGKSWLGHGGQNPAEAIVAGVPVLCGPHMENFEPLISMLSQAGGVKMLESGELLAPSIVGLLADYESVKSMVENAKAVLSCHDGAVEKTIGYLNS